MEKRMVKLSHFIHQTSFMDLPDDVVHEMKRIVMDSIGCTIAGHVSEKGKIAVELAGRLSGPNESTILGTGTKVSCAAAAFANGELMNALDFDALSPGVVHVVPIMLPAILALAESSGVSGKDIILATAVGLEIPVCLKPEGAKTGGLSHETDKSAALPSPVSGFGVSTLAAAAAVSKILNLDEEKTANAIGIAGGMCPPNIFRKFTDTAPVRMTKYGPTGWGAQTGVTSALLAQMGYTGDIDLFEGEYGFWRYTGLGEGRTGDVPAALGKIWQGHKVKYKVYPCGGVLSGVLDGFIEIVKENDFSPEDIQEIVAQPLAVVRNRLWRENELRTPDDYAFNLQYLLACAAHRINPVHWQDIEIRRDPRIREFMQRVAFRMVIDEADFHRAKREDPRTFQMRVEVTAGDRKYRKKVPYPKGAWEPQGFRCTDDELIKKFTDNIQKVLPLKSTDQIAHAILELERFEKIDPLIKMLVP